MSDAGILTDSPAGQRRRFEFSDADFDYLRQLVNTHTGINLSDRKRHLLYGRLSKRLRAHGLTCFRDYCALLADNPGSELEHFVNAVTTNLTSFFRENHHFEYLAQEVIPDLERCRRDDQRLRFWSAGCSTGEEPYSLAMTVRETMPDVDSRDVRILATDLDSGAVETAARGIYQAERIEDMDRRLVKRWFRRGRNQQQGRVKVTHDLRRLITFRQLNLMHDWPMRGPFDVIFCRNVAIYFDRPTQRALFERFAEVMRPGAYLFIGHSETLHDLSCRFRLIGKTIYRRVQG